MGAARASGYGAAQRRDPEQAQRQVFPGAGSGGRRILLAGAIRRAERVPSRLVGPRSPLDLLGHLRGERRVRVAVDRGTCGAGAIRGDGDAQGVRDRGRVVERATMPASAACTIRAASVSPPMTTIGLPAARYSNTFWVASPRRRPLGSRSSSSAGTPRPRGSCGRRGGHRRPFRRPGRDHGRPAPRRRCGWPPPPTCGDRPLLVRDARHGDGRAGRAGDRGPPRRDGTRLARRLAPASKIDCLRYPHLGTPDAAPALHPDAALLCIPTLRCSVYTTLSTGPLLRIPIRPRSAPP